MNRRMSVLFLIVASALGSIAVSAQKKPKPSAAELAAISDRGRLLAEADLAAWHGTDAVLAQRPESGIVERYITRKTPSGWVVAFGKLDDSEDKFLTAYEAVQEGGSQRYKVERFSPAREERGFNLLAARAIKSALRDFQGVNTRYNVAVLPQGEGVYVYIYPAQVNEGVFPLGADARYLVSSDGSTIIEKRQLHKSILAFTGKSPGKTSGGVHSHVLTDLPEDTDVMHVLMRSPKVPEFIAAGDYTFEIRVDGSIRVSR